MGRISIRIFNNPDIGGYYHRKAVNILDSVTTSLPSGTTITLDGYQITDGDRVLFTNLSDSSLNGRVYEADIVDKKLIFKLARDGRASNGDTLDGDTLYVYFGSHKGELWTYDGGTWVQLDVDILESDDIKRDGSAPPLADMPWGGFKLTNLGAPTAANDAVTKAYVDAGISGITEQVEDTVAALIQNGTGINWTYNDPANTLTANVTLSPFSTTDLAEGSNLYFTNERVDDRVAALIQNGTGLSWTYNDGLGTLQGDVSLASFSTTDLAEGSNLYYTAARFNTAFAAKSTTDLTEGSNLYYTDERVDDRVATLIINGPGISWSYNDGAGTLQASVSLASYDTDDLPEGSTNLYFTDERVDDRVAALIQNGTGIQWTYNDGANTLQANVSLSAFSTSDLVEGSNLYYTDERVDDRVSALIQNGTGLTWTYSDVLNTFTGNVSLASFSTTNLAEGSNLYFTDERAQDAVGAALLNSSSLTWSYNDASNQISAVVVASGITHGGLSGLSADDHPQYVLLAGRAGGQTVNGGNAASDNLVLSSTSNPTKGEVRVSDTLRIMGTSRNLLWDVDSNGNIGTSSTNRPDKAYIATGIGIGGANPDSEERIKIAGSSSNKQHIVITNSHSSGESGYKAVNDSNLAVRMVVLGSAHSAAGLISPNMGLIQAEAGLTNGLVLTSLGKMSFAVDGDGSAHEIVRLASGNARLMNTADLLWDSDGAGDIGASGANRPNQVHIVSELRIGSESSGASGKIYALKNAGGVSGLFLETDEGAGLYKGADNLVRLASENAVQVILASDGLALQNNLYWSADGSFDIGNVGANRPYSVNVSNNIEVGGASGTHLNAGQIYGPVGSVGTPTFSFNTTNIGIFASAADTIGFAYSGVQGLALKVDEMRLLGASHNLLWDTDGGGNIGAVGANRPSNIYAVNGIFATDVTASNSLVSQNDILLSAASGANILWNTDAAGNIGAVGANRPANVYIANALHIGSFSFTGSELGYVDDAEGLTSVTLNDNTVSNTLVASWAHASFSSIFIHYSLSRGAGIRESGILMITTDGTTAVLSRSGPALGANGVVFDADISGANVRLLYTTSSTGTNATMKYKLLKWLA